MPGVEPRTCYIAVSGHVIKTMLLNIQQGLGYLQLPLPLPLGDWMHDKFHDHTFDEVRLVAVFHNFYGVTRFLCLAVVVSKCC